ncbi:tRNA dimethylallyltransferase isoform X1 [Nerophis ophidion]|uniref:tRNA dimethylallyltransferase isoform X1 n=1 Tax=Nerophis ophidion TaxID=159077 RepID=UPI002ADF07F8|nr:tRNA dimethylallyltransferase isoform X1 [Nerophis ophidion]
MSNIADMHERNILPIIVGGTNYYIESLLWRVLLDAGKERSGDGGVDRKMQLEKLAGDELHNRLMEVDPKMAAMLHPNDKRKVARSLQVYDETGVPHSSWLEEQRGQQGGNSLGGPLRFQDPCIFWLQADMDELDKRLDCRVDQMLSAGLIEELRDFHARFNQKEAQKDRPNYQHGIFQSIGFKEFHEYLTAPESITQQEKEVLRNKGVAALKMATRRYARKQNKWVRNRFLKRAGAGECVPSVYGLDVTDVSRWEETVVKPALLIVDSLRKREQPAVNAIRMQGAEPGNTRSHHTCHLCHKVIIGDLEWAAHLKSKKHHFQVRKKKRTSECKDSQSRPSVPSSVPPSVPPSDVESDTKLSTHTTH